MPGPDLQPCRVMVAAKTAQGSPEKIPEGRPLQGQEFQINEDPWVFLGSGNASLSMPGPDLQPCRVMVAAKTAQGSPEKIPEGRPLQGQEFQSNENP